jgi:twinkle protein
MDVAALKTFLSQDEENEAFFRRGPKEWATMGGHPAYRALAPILVTDHAPEYEAAPEQALLDVAKLDGKELLARHALRQSRFGTAPFDVTGAVLKFFPGGVTIWSGFPGAGKTTLLRQLVCHLLARGSSVFLASLEEDPSDVIIRLATTAVGCEPTAHQVQWFIDAYAERFRLWGIIGIAEHKKILAVVRKLAEHKIRHVVIDSLMCLDIANDAFEEQRKFANLLSATARTCNIHIHLVAHPRKLLSSDQDPDLNDVAGTREIGGIADNVIFVRRVKSESGTIAVTPMRILICKQRHGTGYIGEVMGHYHRAFKQLHLDQFAEQPTRYLPADAYT